MQHRNKVILNKIVSELDYGINLLSNMIMFLGEAWQV